MKILNCYFLIFFTLFQNFSTENTINEATTCITYKAGRYNSMNENIATKKMEISPLDAQLELLEFNLIYNSTSSIFLPMDAISKNDDDFNYKSARIMTGDICYKNTLSKEKIEKLDCFGIELNIIKNYEEYSWTITTETKMINGFKCYKATTQIKENDLSRERVNTFNPCVWFAPSIPAPFGPKGLDGLPGLVLEGTFNGRIYFYATKINFNCDSNKKIVKPSSGKYLSVSESAKICDDAFRKAIGE